MALRIHLKRRAKRPAVDPLGLKRFVRSVLRGEGITDGALTLVLAGDETLRELNARYRGKGRATDVLAFPLDDPDEDGPYLGDVVVSLDRARAQAPRYRHDLESELARLLAHGVLHLLGYDHHAPAEGRAMKAAERRALAALPPGSLLRESEGGRA